MYADISPDFFRLWAAPVRHDAEPPVQPAPPRAYRVLARLISLRWPVKRLARYAPAQRA